MASYSSTVAQKIPWMEEPGRLQSMGSLRVRHDWVTSLSRIGEGNGNLLQCSCLENPRDGGAWWAAVYGVTQSRTRLKQLGRQWGRRVLLLRKTSLYWKCKILITVTKWERPNTQQWSVPLRQKVHYKWSLFSKPFPTLNNLPQEGSWDSDQFTSQWGWNRRLLAAFGR